MSRREEKNKKAVAKDAEEIEKKKQEYAEYMDWTDRGILVDLKEMFDMEKPTKDDLKALARIVGEHLNIEVDRQDKRRKEFMVGWFNKNYELIRPVLSQMVLIGKNGEAHGNPEWEEFNEKNCRIHLRYGRICLYICCWAFIT